MNYESPAGRAHLMKSLRLTVAHLEKHGQVPRHVLADVLSSTARELGTTPASAATAKQGGNRYETTNVEFTPEQYLDGPHAAEITKALRVVSVLEGVAAALVKEFGIGATLSGFASMLAQLLVDFKTHGKEGEMIAKGVLDNLVQCVNSGRAHVTEFHVQKEH